MKDILVKAVGLEKEKFPIMGSGGRVLYHHGIMYVLKGEGYFEDVHTQRQKVVPGTAFYLYPNCWHRFDPSPQTTWTEYWIMFDGQKARELFGDILPNASPIHTTGIIESVVESYEELHDIWHYSPTPDPGYIVYLLHKILGELYVKIKGLKTIHDHDMVKRAKTVLKSRMYVREFSFKEFAHKEKIGYHQFRKQFKKETSLSPKHYFLMAKMNRAKELLINRNIRIQEVAYRLGFSDPYYFSRLFKIKEGCSPKQFRENMLKKVPTTIKPGFSLASLLSKAGEDGDSV